MPCECMFQAIPTYCLPAADEVKVASLRGGGGRGARGGSQWLALCPSVLRYHALQRSQGEELEAQLEPKHL